MPNGYFPVWVKYQVRCCSKQLNNFTEVGRDFSKLGHGFPRFKKFGQFKSLLFPQFKKSPLTGTFVTCGGKHVSCSTPLTIAGGHLELPKLGMMPINLHRPIPEGFVVKQARIIKKADRWYASIAIQCDVSVPDPIPHGHPVGVDTGLEKFLATSDGVLVKPPKFFKSLQSRLKVPFGFASSLRRETLLQDWTHCNVEVRDVKDVP